MRRDRPTRRVRLLPVFLLLAAILSSCLGEELRRQKEEIEKQQEQLSRQRREIEQMEQARQEAARKRESCNLAFSRYEAAQRSAKTERAVELYREGLALCPDDEIAHYELGKILAAAGRNREAEEAFAAAVKINPNFMEAKSRLEALQRGK